MKHVDVHILRALRAAGGLGVSGVELAQKLGVTRAAIWARIEELRRLGFEIEANPHLGYRLLSTPDVLLADDLLARLGRRRLIGSEIIVFKETGSTNDVADQLARAGAREGTIVLAEAQTRGRGRLGRRWFSPPGKGIWMSVILRPRLQPQQVTQLTVMCAVSVLEAIHAVTGLIPEIKWPNDILIRGRKLAGILTEMEAELDRIDYAIIGIGVNVNMDACDWPPALKAGATSLLLETGRWIDRPALATALIQQLDRYYHLLKSDQFSVIAREWQAHCTTTGKRVVIRTPTRIIAGVAEAIDQDGALLVRTHDGQIERVIGGDVTVERD